MKSIIRIIFVFLLSPVFLIAQDNPLDKFLNEYSGTPGVYYLDLSTNMISPDGDENSKDVNRIVNIKMISFEENSEKKTTASQMYDSFFKQFNKDDYIGLVEVKGPDDNVEIMVKKEDKIVTEFIITIQESNELTIIAATGNFDLKDLAKLGQFQKCKGLNVIQKICEE